MVDTSQQAQAAPSHGCSSLPPAPSQIIQEVLLRQPCSLLCWLRGSPGPSFGSMVVASGKALPIHFPCSGQDTNSFLRAEGIDCSKFKKQNKTQQNSFRKESQGHRLYPQRGNVNRWMQAPRTKDGAWARRVHPALCTVCTCNFLESLGAESGSPERAGKGCSDCCFPGTVCQTSPFILIL